jgi:hypothetical protein
VTWLAEVCRIVGLVAMAAAVVAALITIAVRRGWNPFK